MQNVPPVAGPLYPSLTPSDNTVPASKTTIVKSMRFVNTDTQARTINIYYKRATSRLISPVNMTLGAGSLAIDDQEITMEAGDLIQGDASVASKIDYVISGIERDA